MNLRTALIAWSLALGSGATALAQTSDPDGNFFSVDEEASLNALPLSFQVGDTFAVTNGTEINLNFLTVTATQRLSMFGLPPGLTFDAINKRITGTMYRGVWRQRRSGPQDPDLTGRRRKVL